MEKELAILFVDIVGSTGLYEKLGNIKGSSLTQELLRQLAAAVESQKGQVIKSLGDGLLCVFPQADSAGNAANAMIESQNLSTLKIRIGIHFGSVVEHNGDIFGDAINIAARVEAMAKPGEILATEEVIIRFSAFLRNFCVLIDSTVVKGKTVPIAIYQVRRKEDDHDNLDSTVIGDSFSFTTKDDEVVLRLSYMGRECVVSRNQPKLNVGRDALCEIKLLSRQASRQHGSIEFVRENFIITDHSSNGTFIKTNDAPPIHLRRDSTKLLNGGLIGFGSVPDSEHQEHVVRYQCDVGK
ncbi:Adenylate/guanylate cyclase domain-containing protein [Azospirillaceae bacterium]